MLLVHLRICRSNELVSISSWSGAACLQWISLEKIRQLEIFDVHRQNHAAIMIIVRLVTVN